MVHTFDPSDDFEPGFFEALGRLVAEFGRLEYMLKLAVKRLRRVSFGEGMLVAEAMHLEPLGDEAKALFQQRVSDAGRTAEFVARVSEAITIWEERNDNVHCFWTALKDRSPKRYRPKLLKTGSKKTLDWSRGKVIPVADLQNLANRAAGLWRFIDTETENLPP